MLKLNCCAGMRLIDLMASPLENLYVVSVRNKIGGLTRAVMKNECSLLMCSDGQDADIRGDVFVHDYSGGVGGKQARWMTKQKNTISSMFAFKIQLMTCALGRLPCNSYSPLAFNHHSIFYKNRKILEIKVPSWLLELNEKVKICKIFLLRINANNVSKTRMLM